MDILFPDILGFLLAWRYVALFVVAFLGSFGVPLPIAASVIAASAFASEGHFNIFLIFVSGAAGNIGGDLTLYWLVRRYGRQALLWLRLRKLADSPALLGVETAVNTYSSSVIIASRFQVQTTAIVNVIAGLAKMDFRRFALRVCIGESLQMAFYVIIGYLFSSAWQTIYAVVGKLSWAVALALAIALAIVSTKIVQRKME